MDIASIDRGTVISLFYTYLATVTTILKINTDTTRVVNNGNILTDEQDGDNIWKRNTTMTYNYM